MNTGSLHCFGVGDGMACADRHHASFLYALDKTSLLIDCGEPVSRSYQALQRSADEIDQIFLSHLHSDHVAGFFMLIQGFWLERRRKPLEVYMPADGIQPVRQMLRAGYLFDELLKFKLQFKPIKERRALRQKGVSITAFRTSHLERLRKSFQNKYPGDYLAYSFLIETGDLRIGHSADMGAVEDLDPLLAQPLDLLICELSHFTPRQLFAALQGKDIRQIVFTHVGRRYWENLHDTRRLAKSMLPGRKLSFARDQQIIPLRTACRRC
jgi:ribonuclease Z